jgi:hypothetical protein
MRRRQNQQQQNDGVGPAGAVEPEEDFYNQVPFSYPQRISRHCPLLAREKGSDDLSVKH